MHATRNTAQVTRPHQEIGKGHSAISSMEAFDVNYKQTELQSGQIPRSPDDDDRKCKNGYLQITATKCIKQQRAFDWLEYPGSLSRPSTTLPSNRMHHYHRYQCSAALSDYQYADAITFHIKWRHNNGWIHQHKCVAEASADKITG